LEKQFKRRLSDAMKRTGFDYAALADLFDVTSATIWKWKTGQSEPRGDTKGRVLEWISTTEGSPPSTPAPKPAQPSSSTDQLQLGHVYFVQGATDSPVKVGFTREGRLEQRIAQLQTAHPDQLRLIHHLSPAYETNERAIHALLKPYQTRDGGEWFLADAVLALVNAIKVDQPDLKTDSPLSLMATQGFLSQTEPASWLHQLAEQIVTTRVRLLEFAAALPALPLKGWLALQERDDPVGDLAQDVTRAPAFPNAATLRDYISHLPDLAHDACATAYLECFWDIRELQRPLYREDLLPWIARRGTRLSL
jgi:hypothetical protein